MSTNPSIEEAMKAFENISKEVIASDNKDALEAIEYANNIINSISTGKQVDIEYFKILMQRFVNNKESSSRDVNPVKNNRRKFREKTNKDKLS